MKKIFVVLLIGLIITLTGCVKSYTVEDLNQENKKVETKSDVLSNVSNLESKVEELGILSAIDFRSTFFNHYKELDKDYYSPEDILEHNIKDTYITSNFFVAGYVEYIYSIISSQNEFNEENTLLNVDNDSVKVFTNSNYIYMYTDSTEDSLKKQFTIFRLLVDKDNIISDVVSVSYNGDKKSIYYGYFDNEIGMKEAYVRYLGHRQETLYYGSLDYDFKDETIMEYQVIQHLNDEGEYEINTAFYNEFWLKEQFGLRVYEIPGSFGREFSLIEEDSISFSYSVTQTKNIESVSFGKDIHRSYYSIKDVSGWTKLQYTSLFNSSEEVFYENLGSAPFGMGGQYNFFITNDTTNLITENEFKFPIEGSEYSTFGYEFFEQLNNDSEGLYDTFVVNKDSVQFRNRTLNVESSYTDSVMEYIPEIYKNKVTDY